MSTIPIGSGTIYIQNSGNDVQYSSDNTSWATISAWPATITNTPSPSPSNILKVLFNDMTISSTTTNSASAGTDCFFICGSEYIQFGDTSLGTGGTRPTITIDGITTGYPGLIKNFFTSPSVGSYGNINIYNLIVDGSVGGTSLAQGGGWICQGTFGVNLPNNVYIINCSSIGNISVSSGGIIGSGCLGGTGSGKLFITGCSNSGIIDGLGQGGGGIIGSGCGNTTATPASILIDQCYSTGSIGIRAGGICGSGSTGVNITKSYSSSTSFIATLGGGIFGESASNCNITNCYSLVPSGDSKGLFGSSATNCTANTCYINSTTTGANTNTNCYFVYGTWNDTNANTALGNTLGTIWYSTATDTPFILRNFGASPYVLNNISSNALVQTKSSSLPPSGSSTSAAVVPEYTSYSIISSPVPTGISINSTTGVISTTSSTPSGTYNLTIYSNYNPYAITTYNLTVDIICFLEGSTITCLVGGEEKQIPVEKIRKGTLVKTLNDGYKKVEMIGSRPIENPGDSERTQNRLYKLTKEKYPELEEDLYLTGCHSVLVDELSKAEQEETVNQLGVICVTDRKYRLMANIDARAEPWASKGTYTVWHFALETDDAGINFGVYANGGLLVETCSIHYLKNKANMTFH